VFTNRGTGPDKACGFLFNNLVKTSNHADTNPPPWERHYLPGANAGVSVPKTG